VSSPDTPVAPRRFSPARIRTFKVLEQIFRRLGGRRFYRARFLAPGRLVQRFEEVHVPAGPGTTRLREGYRIAALSDFHAGSFLGPGDLDHALELVAQFVPHVICLLGDFIVDATEESARIVPDLARLHAPDGVFSVFGNHDYRGRREHEIEATLGEHGIRFLRNRGVRLGADASSSERNTPGLVLVGIEDAEEGRAVDLDAARAALVPGDIEIALSHHPWMAKAFAQPSPSGRGAHLVLSGHTHGLQIDLPFVRGLGPAHPGVRVELGATTLLVSRGLGVVGAPLRIGAPAEVLCVTLRETPAATP